MVGGEGQHALVNMAWGDDGALDGKAVGEQWHVWDSEVTLGDGEREDGSAWSEDGEVQVPVRLETGGDEELVDGLLDIEALGTLGSVEFGSAELHGLVSLAVGATEDDDLAAHLGGELDGQVTETANADDTDAVGWLGVVHVKSVEDGGTTAHQGSGSLVLELVGNLEEEGLTPDGAVSEGTLVVVGVTVHGTFRAVGLGALQALLAVAA